MSEQKYIVCINRAGLGNRLKGLISAMRLSRITKRKLLLYWENNQYLGCDFKDLFENEIEQINENQLKEIKEKNSFIVRDIIEEGWEKYDYLVIDSWKFQFLPGEIPKGFAEVYSSEKGGNIDFEFQKVPENIREMFFNELFSLKPVAEIKNKISEFDLTHNLKNYIGLHIRRGDNWITVDGRERIGTDDEFIGIIKSMPETRFLLCTDGVETEKYLKELFGERIITYEKGDRKRSKKESVHEALIDMILLSKTQKIYGSFLSTFTELAWWFGGCKTDVIIVGQENINKEFKPKTFFQKVKRRIRFYWVNFRRWMDKTY